MDIGNRIAIALVVGGLFLSLKALGRAAPSAIKYGLSNRAQVEGGLGMLKRLFRK